jgi:hypothetical protein
MASTQDELDLVFIEIGSNFKDDRTTMGLLSSLSTTQKTSLVAAINEVFGRTASAGAQINDVTAGNTTVYSSTKTDTQIASARSSLKTEILGGVGAAYDTLQELVTYFNGLDSANDADVASLVTLVGTRLRFDAAQVLTVSEKAQANTNLGSVSLAQFGDPTHSYRTVFLNALA